MAGVIRESRNSHIKLIEFHFFREREIREAVYEMKQSTGGKTGGAPTGHSRISDPTALKAIRQTVEIKSITLDNGARIMYPEKWVKVFDAVRGWCAEDKIKAEILERRYRKAEKYNITCEELHIESHLYYYILQKIRSHAETCAAYLHLIKIL